ncbi:MAG: hypothetical protein AAF636_02580 [Pseudomonadota bacterium]
MNFIPIRITGDTTARALMNGCTSGETNEPSMSQKSAIETLHFMYPNPVSVDGKTHMLTEEIQKL